MQIRILNIDSHEEDTNQLRLKWTENRKSCWHAREKQKNMYENFDMLKCPDRRHEKNMH